MQNVINISTSDLNIEAFAGNLDIVAAQGLGKLAEILISKTVEFTVSYEEKELEEIPVLYRQELMGKLSDQWANFIDRQDEDSVVAVKNELIKTALNTIKNEHDRIRFYKTVNAVEDLHDLQISLTDCNGYLKPNEELVHWVGACICALEDSWREMPNVWQDLAIVGVFIVNLAMK